MKLEAMHKQLTVLSDAIIKLKQEVERELQPKRAQRKSKVQLKEEEIAAKFFGAQAKKATKSATKKQHA